MSNFVGGVDEQGAFEKLEALITSDEIMIFFNPHKPILVRAEESYKCIMIGCLPDYSKTFEKDCNLRISSAKQ